MLLECCYRASVSTCSYFLSVGNEGPRETVSEPVRPLFMRDRRVGTSVTANACNCVPQEGKGLARSTDPLNNSARLRCIPFFAMLDIDVCRHVRHAMTPQCKWTM